MKALIDGDILVYRCGFAAEHNRYTLGGVGFENYNDMRAWAKAHGLEADELKEAEVRREIEPVENALSNVKSVMGTILETLGVTDHNYITFLSSGECFRNDIATIMEYKGNRRDAPRPVHYDAIRTYIQKHHPTVMCNSIEADDALAMCKEEDDVIVSIDKDLLQIPGKHYNWVKDERILILPEVGRKKFWMQVLTGDSTDNIPGIYGIGEKRARDIINSVKVEDHVALAADDYYYMEVLNQWEEFLKSDKKKPFINLNYHSDVNAWSYEHWSGAVPEPIIRSVGDIVMEICQLISIGGEDAQQALEESGEEIPLPRTTKRKESAAA